MDFSSRVVAPEEQATPDNAASPPLFPTAALRLDGAEGVNQLLGSFQLGGWYTRGGDPDFDAVLGDFGGGRDRGGV